MKLKIFLSGLLLLVIALSSCKDTDDIDFGSRDVDKDLLTITAYLDEGRKNGVVATVDRTNKKIVFELPYYSSDTEPNITQVNNLILSASIPDGAVLTPKLQTISDLTNPVSLTIEYVNYEVEHYEMSALLVKSNKADITKMVIEDMPTVSYSITEQEGENKILVYRTSSTIYDALKNAKVSFTISPWSSIDVKDGAAMDLTVRNKITVTAQDGSIKEYFTEMVDPEYVPDGQIGQITLLFGWQLTTTNARGFDGNSNRSLAVVDNELVVAHDAGNFLRLNRYTGVTLDKKVNITGINTGAPNLGLMGIDSDDNGVLLAVTFSMVGNASYSPNVDLYVWKDGLDSPPTRIMSKPVGEVISTGDIGRTVSVKGDLISGKAVIGLIAKTAQQGLMYKVENGAVVNADSPWRGTYGVTFNNNGKLIPMDTEENPSYILSGINGRAHYYCTTSPASTRQINAGGDWWPSDTKGSDYIEFNGVKILAAQNGSYGANGADNYNRLVAANITTYAADVFSSKRIMDSRLQNFDPNVSGAANATITGMTSFYVQGGSTVGNNGNKTGDVCFGRNADGSAVQVYMMTTGHGVIAYDISRFAPF